MNRSSLKVFDSLSFLFAFCALAGTVRAEPERAKSLTFEEHVWPIFRAHCFDCHGATDAKQGGLDLRLVRFIVRGGDSGPAIEPGRPDVSHLIRRIRAGEMPPKGAQMPAEDLDLVEKWIAQGARTARPEPKSIPPGLGILPEEREFWAYQPVTRPNVPAVDQAVIVRTPIDAFLLTELREHGLSFAPEADRLSLLQRACFDLTGLPPTRELTEEFLADESPQAYERLIERLMASPHYGERWGRHWLDVAGYADSEGYTNDDPVRDEAYRYRDYVIRSLNEDKPFDQFIVEQLAGDELIAPPYEDLSADEIEKLTATGFLRMAADGTASGNVDQDAARNQVVADTIKIMSSALLGLSVGCAQCHDHRYDPIPQTDYYRLRAVLEPAYDWKQWRTPNQRRVSLYTDADRARAAGIEREAQAIVAEKEKAQTEYMAQALEMELKKQPEELRDALREAYNTPADERTSEQNRILDKHPSVKITPGVLYQYLPEAAEELKKIDQRIAEVRARKPAEEFLRVLTEIPGQVPATHLFHRGDHRQPKDAVPPGGLTVTAPPGERFEIATDDPALPTTGRRLAYAKWLVSGHHPLVGRVLVNRLWMHHFGRGLVNTPSDFGRLGNRPSHPELLDWLASEFARQGWSLKQMHRLIMLSTAYRQSSARTPENDAVDVDNRLYGRMPVRRLEAELVRDRILAATGGLAPRLYGPAVPVKADDAGQVIVDPNETRRSVYVQVRRSQPVSLLTAFDAPVMEVNCERRPSSTVATQSLMLMNSEFIRYQARQFAERVRREAPEPADTVLAQKEFDALAPAWQYGYGRIDEGSGRVERFQPLPHWTGSAWQGGPSLPDLDTGWAMLNAAGGHPGRPQFAAIRRWIAPSDGRIEVRGVLKHPSDQGDGVRGRIVLGRIDVLGDWIARHGDAQTTVGTTEVHRGDVLDFVADCRTNEGYDGFHWAIEIRLFAAAGTEPLVYKSSADFHGPQPSMLPAQVQYAWQLAYQRPPDSDEMEVAAEFLARQMQHLRSTGASADVEQEALTNLCQVLLSSNEFLYVD